MMGYKIGILEPYGHAENIFSTATLSKYHNAEVWIFTTERFYTLANPFFNDTMDDYNWIIQKETETDSKFLKRVKKICDDHIDLLFLNIFYSLPHHQMNFYFFRPKCKIVHQAGRVEYLFGEKLPFQFQSIKAFVLSFLNNISQIIRKMILQNFDGIWVDNKDAYNYAIASGYKNKIFSIPFHYCNHPIKTYQGDREINFVTIGYLDGNRRDYTGLLDAFEQLFSTGKQNFTLTLLGAPVGQKGLQLIERCKKLIEKGMKITFFTTYLHEDVMDKELLSSDIIINPGHVSNYGTGTAGAIKNAMQFGKPGIYPTGSVHYDELLSSSIFYEKIEELKNIIEHFLDNPDKLQKLSQEAIVNSKKFSIDNLAKDFKKQILERFYDR